jgi:hypothetical protein
MLTWELRSFGNHHPEEGATTGTAFYGTDASVVVDNRGWTVYAKGSSTPAEVHKAAGGSHEQNFIECIKSRKRPNADVEIGRISTTLCHLGNIACGLGRSVEFDAEAENFGVDAVANARLRKVYREGWALPKV